jgi:uncharacterized protein YndB with AHSA1/START domain
MTDVSSAKVGEATITRIVDAPREVVFQAWTDPKQVAKWWGPTDFTVPVCELDVRPGGAIRIDMRGPAGTPYDAVFPMRGVFEEIARPSRLVFTDSAFFGDDESPGMEGRTAVTFEEHDRKTKVAVHAVLLKVQPQYAEAAAGMEEGWNQTLDKLAAYLREGVKR